MSQNTPCTWLVAYDIACPKRLAQIFKALKKEGIPVQRSVFSVVASPAKMGSFMVRLAKIINPKEDDVRAYRVPNNPWKATIGTGILPDDVLPGETDLLC